MKMLSHRITTGPTLSSYKGAVVYGLVMFPKCSVFDWLFQTGDWEGRKHLLPVEEVHFQKTTSDPSKRIQPSLHQNSRLFY